MALEPRQAQRKRGLHAAISPRLWLGCAEEAGRSPLEWAGPLSRTIITTKLTQIRRCRKAAQEILSGVDAKVNQRPDPAVTEVTGLREVPYLPCGEGDGCASGNHRLVLPGGGGSWGCSLLQHPGTPGS